MINTTLENLVSVRELLTPESSWTKDMPAKDKYNNSIMCIDPNAVCWCLSGALFKTISDKFFVGNFHYDEFLSTQSELLNVISKSYEFTNSFNRIADFNDSRDTTHRDVLNVIDLAIENATKIN